MEPKKTKVRYIMTPNLKTIHALSPLEKAAKIMKGNITKKLQKTNRNKKI